MRYNKGPAFMHPVTHQVVESGQWYEGNAHVEAENEEIDPTSDLEDTTTPEAFICPKCGKEYKTQKNFDAHVEKCDVIPEGQQGDGVDANVSQ